MLADEAYASALMQRYRQLSGQARGVEDETHPQQRDFVLDAAKRIVATCGRRGGKTDGVARRLIRTCMAGGLAVYFALSRPFAKKLMWQPLKRLDREFELGLVFREGELQVEDPSSGGQIWLLGANTVDEREKARGHAIAEACLDEAGSFGGYLEYLIDEVLDPALQDYDGTLVLTGTPPRVAAGKFFQASVGELPGWSRHSWTVFDNSKFPLWAGDPDWRTKAESWFERYLIERGWSRDDPHVRREWFAEWIHDADSLVYKFDRDRNCWNERPDTDGWVTMMGVDLGYEDDTAIVVGAYSPDDDRLVELDTAKKKHLIASEIAELIGAMVKKYNPRVIRADSGGLGKTLVKEFQKRYQLPILPAEKNAKYDFIEHMNSDLRSGKILINPKSPLADEWSILQWDENKHKEDDRFPNHAADAFLYMWREAQHYRGKRKKPLPKQGTREYAQLEAERLERAARERAQHRHTTSITEALL